MTAERMEVIETSSSAWKADIIAVILHSQFPYLRFQYVDVSVFLLSINLRVLPSLN